MSAPILSALSSIQQAALTSALSAIQVHKPEIAAGCLQVFATAFHITKEFSPDLAPEAGLRQTPPAAPPAAAAAPAAEIEQVPSKSKTPAQKRGKAVEAIPAETPVEEPAADLPEESSAASGYPELDLKALSKLEIPEIRQAGKEWWMGTIDKLTTADSSKGDQLRLEMRAEIGKHKEGSVSIKDIPDGEVLSFWGIVKKLAAKYTA